MKKLIEQLRLFIAFSLINAFSFSRKEKIYREQSILVVCLGGMGDYVLLRNFIAQIKIDRKYENFSFTLLGNGAWKDLARLLDSNVFEEFIFLNRDLMMKSMAYRHAFIQTLQLTEYDAVINPTQSPEFFLDDWIVKSIYADEKIGSVGDNVNSSRWQKLYRSHWYDRLIDQEIGTTFEFYKNKYFFENLINSKILIHGPTIIINDDSFLELPSKKYAILFLGAANIMRKWPLKRYLEVGLYLSRVHELDIVLCGGEEDITESGWIESGLSEYDVHVVNMVGKTSILELLKILSGGKILISNDTGACHLAVALGLSNIVVVSNGNHFGRFAPYPNEICGGYKLIVHPSIMNTAEKKSQNINDFKYGSGLDIGGVKASDVISAIDILISE